MHICFTPPCFGISSCVPNAVLTFDGRTAYVRALQPIGKDEEVRKTPLPCALIILCLTCTACFCFVFSPLPLLSFGTMSVVYLFSGFDKLHRDSSSN